jgi:hypothetical protein
LRLANGGTIVAWIKPTDFGRGGLSRIVDKTADYFGTTGYFLGINQQLNTSNALVWAAAGSLTCGSQHNVIQTNVWEQVAVTINPSGSTRLFVNGADVSDNSVGCSGSTKVPPNVASAVTIGARTATTDRTFNGLIDDVRIYSNALSAAEIKEFYAQGGKAHGLAQQ